MPKSAASGSKNAKPANEPRLGIFWLLPNGRLLMDSAPLSECEQYGDHLNYPRSHIDVWERWRQVGKAPAETEYEEFPRGRTVYNAPSGFAILTDACIRKRKDVIVAIKNEFHLPKKTSVGGDPHYRCFTCLHGSADDEKE